MFRRYKLFAYFADDLIYKRTFYSFNHLLKVCTGFDPNIYFEVEDIVSDKLYPNSTIRELVNEFLIDFNDYDEEL